MINNNNVADDFAVNSIKCKECGSVHVQYGVRTQYYVTCGSCGHEEEVSLNAVIVAVSAVGAAVIFGFLKTVVDKYIVPAINKF